jgi:hypothetical protein
MIFQWCSIVLTSILTGRSKKNVSNLNGTSILEIVALTVSMHVIIVLPQCKGTKVDLPIFKWRSMAVRVHIRKIGGTMHFL